MQVVDGGSDGDGDGDGIDVDTFPVTDSSTSSIQLPSDASTEKISNPYSTTLRVLLLEQILLSLLHSLDLNVSASLDSKDAGSICNKQHFNSLKHCWLYQPGSKKHPVGGGVDKVGQSIKQGIMITLKLSRHLGALAIALICKYRVLTVYDKSYNK